jgi:hypothetical protein
MLETVPQPSIATDQRVKALVALKTVSTEKPN